MVSEPETMIAIIGRSQWTRPGVGGWSQWIWYRASGYGSFVIILSAQVLWVLTLGLWTLDLGLTICAQMFLHCMSL